MAKRTNQNIQEVKDTAIDSANEVPKNEEQEATEKSADETTVRSEQEATKN